MDGLCLTGEPCPAPRGRTARLPPGCLTAPVNPSQPQFDHPYDSPVNYRGRLGFSGGKGTLPGTRSSAEAGSSTIFSELGAPRRAGAPPHAPASPQGDHLCIGSGAQAAISRASGAESNYQRSVSDYHQEPAGSSSGGMMATTLPTAAK